MYGRIEEAVWFVLNSPKLFFNFLLRIPAAPWTCFTRTTQREFQLKLFIGMESRSALPSWIPVKRPQNYNEDGRQKTVLTRTTIMIGWQATYPQTSQTSLQTSEVIQQWAKSITAGVSQLTVGEFMRVLILDVGEC